MRIARARSMSAIWVQEYLLELFLIGYPCTCLRAIAQDLRWSAAACQVRWVIRTWIVMAGSKDLSNMKISRGKRGSSPKSGHRGKQLEERRVKMRRSWRRRARSSPSPSSTDSSSSAARRLRRVEKAQRILQRKDPAANQGEGERSEEARRGAGSGNDFAVGWCAPQLCDLASRGAANSVCADGNGVHSRLLRQCRR